MAKDQNPFTQFGGHLESLGIELAKRLRIRGLTIADAVARVVQPENVGVLDEIASVLGRLANIFRVKIGGKRTVTEVVGASGLIYFDCSILERCVLKQGPEKYSTIELFDIEHFDHDPTDAEIETEYVRRRLKRPTPDHAIHFGDQCRDLPVDGHPVVFYLENPFPGADGGRCVLGFWRHGTRRRLRWLWLSPSDRWLRYCLFAGVRE